MTVPTIETVTKSVQASIRTLEDKLRTALDTQEWLQTLWADQEPDEDIACVLSVLRGLISNYRLVREKRKMTEHEWYQCRNDFTLASVLLAEHIEEYGQELAHFDYSMVPQTAVELIFIVLNDAILQLSQALELGRMRNYQPLTETEIQAICALL